MKYLLPIFIIAFISPFIYLRLFHKPVENIKDNQNKSTNIDKSHFKLLEFENKQYLYDYFIINQGHDLVVSPNLSDKQTSQAYLLNNSCKFLISGGFYDKQFNPIGLIISDSRLISPFQENWLFNGFLVQSPSGSLEIFKKINPKEIKSAIQTGPLLIHENSPLDVIVKDDDPGRRIVAINTNDNQMIFTIIVSSDSMFTGPRLSDLTEIVNQISQIEKFTVSSAINLDGGSASTFYKDQYHYKELKTVGTFLCFK